MKHEGPSRCSQEQAIGPYAEPIGPTLQPPTPILILPSRVRLHLPSSLFFRFSDEIFVCISYLSHAC
jgi:hypothetical protein